MKPLLNGISHKSYLTGNPYDLAIHRYIDALIRSEVNAYKIQYAMTAFEALLSNESAEITYKIRIRVAGLLHALGFNTIAVFTQMRDAYSLRSKLVHGSKTKEKNKDLLEFARQHTHEIINYTRICFLICLQLRNFKGKDSLIELIDHSLIDAKKYEELSGLIQTNVFNPILNPFQNEI